MDGVAILGAGLYPKIAYLPPLHALGAKVVAIYSRSESSAAKLAEEGKKLDGLLSSNFSIHHEGADESKSLKALIARADVHSVIISLPTLIQPGIALQCLAAGKHVLMEKPITKDVATGINLIKEYESVYQPKGLILAVGEQFRFDPGHLAARDIVASGKLGQLEAVHLRKWECTRQGNPWYETPWRKFPEYQGGFLLDGGVHFVSLVRLVAGEITETASFAKQVLDYLPPVDTVQAALKFASGALGTLSMSYGSVRDEYSYVFVGREGSMTINADPGGTKIVLSDAFSKVIREEVVSGAETYKLMFGAFFDAVKAGKGQPDPRANMRQGLADVAVVESVIHGGGKVQVYTA